MSDPRISLLKAVLEQGTGADVVVEIESSGLRAGLRAYFDGLTANQGPVFTITPTGLRRQRVSMRFGSFSAPLIGQMRQAGTERLDLARALVEQLATRPDISVTLTPEQDLTAWSVTGQSFAIEVLLRKVELPTSEEAVLRSASEVMVPLMAAMAELIGYDESEPDEYDIEGLAKVGTLIRRERSPRNRLLCLSIHGHQCKVCNFVPSDVYGNAGSIIEVHHLEPISLLGKPRAYDPRTDLIPLCPNCHRAIHTKRPVPWTIEELRELMRHGGS